MEFSPSVEEYISFFLPIIKTHRLSKKQKKIFDNILNQLYNDLTKAHNYVTYQIKKECFQKDIQQIVSIKQIDNPNIYNSRFFPKHIREYVNSQSSYHLKYKCKIHNKTIRINFILSLEEDIQQLHLYDQYVKYVYMWIYMASLYSSKNLSNTLNLYFYMTPFKKYLPTNDILGPKHVNSGYSSIGTREGEIVIFRKEEWFKVLIHETFHSFGLDFARMSQGRINKKFKNIFPINSEFNIFEAYTESWAEIINSVFISYHLIRKKKVEVRRKEFFKFSRYCLEIEKIFSLYQCVKILKYMGLTYSNLYTKDEQSMYARKTCYQENTNVFSYYILTAILMNNYIGFMDWCNNENISLLKFHSNQRSLDSFYDYVVSQYKSSNLLQNLKYITGILNNQKFDKDKNENKLLTTTRMTIIEFE